MGQLFQNVCSIIGREEELTGVRCLSDGRSRGALFVEVTTVWIIVALLMGLAVFQGVHSSMPTHMGASVPPTFVEHSLETGQ